jgi:hypothetical protein
MNDEKLNSNDELFHFLTNLSEELRQKGETRCVDLITLASRFYFGTPISEFLYESYYALLEIQKIEKTLSIQQVEKIQSVIDQLRSAFKQVGDVPNK